MSTFGFLTNQKFHGRLRKRELARIVARSTRAILEEALGRREDVAAAADFESSENHSEGRRLFRTKNGYIGLGGRDVRAGDNVVLLAGANAPFVLRPSDGGRFRVVSDAYVVGMMHGELWDEQGCDMIWLE
jgi:hypothetical protein